MSYKSFNKLVNRIIIETYGICMFKRKNGILESPTGTGKTLCLLCSSISWLLAAKADIQYSVAQNEMSDRDETAMAIRNINKS